MKPGKIVLLIILTVVFCSAGCKQSARKEQVPHVLATVNGVPIYADDVLIRLGGHEEFMNSSVKDEALDEIINEELMYQKGVKLGLDKDRKFQSTILQMELKIAAYKRAEMSRRIKNGQIAAKVNITEQDIKDYYDKNAGDIGTELHIAAIQFPDENQAKEALARIRSGTPFEQVAAEKFAHVPKGKGTPWDKGFLNWSQIPTEWLSAVYSLNKGEVSDVLKSEIVGIQILKVIDKRKNRNASYGATRTIVTNRLGEIKIKEAYEGYIRQLKSQAKVIKQ